MTITQLARLIAEDLFVEEEEIKSVFLELQRRCMEKFETYVLVSDFLSGENKLVRRRKIEKD